MEKQRGRSQRTWVKLDCNGILHGSINWQLTLEEQAVWIKTFVYSAVCGGKPGMIQDNEMKPLPHEYIASELHCPLDVFESMLKKSKDDKRLKENSSGIEVVNFKAYQFNEYDRQKPYREKQKEINFEAFVEEIRLEYADLNFGNELKKFHLYWSEGNRKLQRPKLALKNWMDKAREFKKRDKEAGSGASGRHNEASGIDRLKASIGRPLD